MAHPLSTSTSHYEASAGDPAPAKPSDSRRSPEKTIRTIDGFGEYLDLGTWIGDPIGKKTDYVNHHVYPMVPVWTTTGPSWVRANDDKSVGLLKDDRMLWYALCSRIRRWADGIPDVTRLITEFGTLERATPGDSRFLKKNRRPFPAYAHFAYWAGLTCGLAGLPFKWNDGKTLGEMSPHGSCEFSKNNYGVNIFPQVKSVVTFLDGVELDCLRPAEYTVVDEKEKPCEALFAWAIASPEFKLIWIVDSRFGESGFNCNSSRRLSIATGHPGQSYAYRFFNTWNGCFLNGWRTERASCKDRIGTLLIPLPDFPRTDPTATGVKLSVDIAVQVRTEPPPRLRFRERAPRSHAL